MVDGVVHAQSALRLAGLVAERAGEHFPGVLVDVPDVVAQVVLPGEALEAGGAVQV